MSDIIFHHYDPSPFGEKIRSIFGFKGLAWQSVQIPRMMPKPDVMPLTGGYRKTPVMQIGAHIFCDTQTIIRELETRFPTPTLFPNNSEFLGWGMSFWTDKLLFGASAGIVFGAFGDKMPEEFIKDRAEYSGGNINVEKMKAALPYTMQQYKTMLDWAEQGLSDGRSFFLGEEASLVDFDLYYNLWFVSRVPEAKSLVDEFPKLSKWVERVAGFGHGQQSELSSTDALAVAKEDDVSGWSGSIEEGEGLSKGNTITVMPNDTGRVPVTGELLSLTKQEVAIRHNNDTVGDVIIHFPRAGFIIS
ncbi:MAG: glutathione S-transferase family protein [Proteobacteria bacterium]|nr:glutathione S-transferase family protein [Pseudomonadota bacterium]